MASINSISVNQLARLIGTPKCPLLIDVRIDDDFSRDPRFIPTSTRRPHHNVGEWAPSIEKRSVVVVCQRGEKLSHGTAAWLRHEGIPAENLEGGFEAWQKAGLPLVPSKPPTLRDRVWSAARAAPVPARGSRQPARHRRSSLWARRGRAA